MRYAAMDHKLVAKGMGGRQQAQKLAATFSKPSRVSANSTQDIGSSGHMRQSYPRIQEHVAIYATASRQLYVRIPTLGPVVICAPVSRLLHVPTSRVYVPTCVIAYVMQCLC